MRCSRSRRLRPAYPTPCSVGTACTRFAASRPQSSQRHTLRTTSHPPLKTHSRGHTRGTARRRTRPVSSSTSPAGTPRTRSQSAHLRAKGTSRLRTRGTASARSRSQRSRFRTAGTCRSRLRLPRRCRSQRHTAHSSSAPSWPRSSRGRTRHMPSPTSPRCPHRTCPAHTACMRTRS